MAKKDFTGGFDKLLGGASAREYNEPSTEEQQVEPTRTSGRGRPKKWEGNHSSEGYMRTSLILNEEKYKKVGAISVKENILLKDLVEKALDMLIEAYEAKNGAIELIEKKAGDINNLF